MLGQEGEERRLFDACLAPDVDQRETAREQEPGKCLGAHLQPPLRVLDRDEWWMIGDLER
jgi:hypothetical protein